MAHYNIRMEVVKRSEGRSIIAAAAYRSGEKIFDERQGMTHDFRHKLPGIEHKELIFPDDAPAWVRGIDRGTFWNAVDASEKRKDAQTARDFRIMIPREVPPADRVAMVRDYLVRNFVSKGMACDLCFHNTIASDMREQPHAHVLLTMRPLNDTGFGKKKRHDWVPDPSGRSHPDGRPVMMESDADSWNSKAYFERCREEWETSANAALERAGSPERIDRRSYLERGIARMAEPMLGVAYHMKELYGAMRDRFGHFQVAKHYREVERRAKAAFEKAAAGPASPADLVRTANRFIDWFDRQIERLAPERAPSRDRPAAPSNDLER